MNRDNYTIHETALGVAHEEVREALNNLHSTAHDLCRELHDSWKQASVSWHELDRVYRRLREYNVPNAASVWSDAGLPEIKHVRREMKRFPQPGFLAWFGVWPIVDDDYPMGGTPVGYVLLTDDLGPLYHGTTVNFMKTLNRHEAEGRAWERWVAYRSDDPWAAGEVKSRFIGGQQPAWNKRPVR